MDIKDYLLDNIHSIRVSNDYKVNEKFYVNDYMHGRCHLFALIASEILGAPLQAFVAPHAQFGYCLSHVFCKINKNTILDASGLWNFYSMKEKYEEPNMYLHSDGFRLKQELWEMMKLKEIPYYHSFEEKSIINYIEEMNRNSVLCLLLKENEAMVHIEKILNVDKYKVKIFKH